MNKQRERLVEILSTETAEDFYLYELAETGCCKNEYVKEFADFLLANGVIVPPCKVGDTAYRIVPQNPSLKISEYIVLGFHFGNFPDNLGRKRKNYLIVRHGTSSLLSHFSFDLIAKSVFFNKKEAEKALKECGFSD